MPAIRLVGDRGAASFSGPQSHQVQPELRLSEQQHQDLYHYIFDRLFGHNSLRVSQVERLRDIDREVNGFINRDAEDQDRAHGNRLGHGVKPVDNKLPMTFAQLDEALTFMMTVLAPDEGIYTAIAPREQQVQAKGFSRLMNQHAEKYGHYVEIMKAIFNGLKYNEGGMMVNWHRTMGNRAVKRVAGNLTTQQGVMYEGNRLESIDMYNVIYDTSVPWPELNQHGEFIALIDMLPPFRFRKMEQDGMIFGADRFLNDAGVKRFYETKPVIGPSHKAMDGVTDWYQVLSMTGSSTYDDFKAIERWKVYMWLDPTKFGLVKKKDWDGKMQIWRFMVANDKYVIEAEHMQNSHGMLPCCGTRPIDDHFNWQTRSFGELLTPFNQFSSHEMNVHQRARRKRLIGGLTIYNEQVIPELGGEQVDMAGGKVAARTSGTDMDLRRHVLQLNEPVDTGDIANNIEMADGLMQKVLPTDMAKQVASLDRATQFQAAATVQGSNRRNLKYGKVIDTQMMTPCRHMQMYNIFEFQQSVEVITEQGQLEQIDPSDLVEAHLEFQIADGLRGLDKLSIIMHAKEMINNVIQSQQAIAQTDIMALLNYISSLWGDDTDWSQFKVHSPIDTLPAEQRDLAYQLLQQFAAQQQQAQGGTPVNEGNRPTGNEPTPITALATAGAQSVG